MNISRLVARQLWAAGASSSSMSAELSIAARGLHACTALASSLGPMAHQPPVGAPQAAATAATAPAEPSGPGSASQQSGPAQQSASQAAEAGATAAAGAAAAVRQAVRGAGAGGGGSGGWAGVPPVARTLGLAGAIPFIALSPPVASVLPLLPLDLVNNAALWQVAYGATICSFLGGVHWGAAFGESAGAVASGASRANFERYLWGVTPSLMAWPAVAMGGGPGAFVIATTLGIVYLVDRSFARRRLLPPWYMWLRLPLTAFATGGCLLTVYDSLAKENQRVHQPRGEAAA